MDTTFGCKSPCLGLRQLMITAGRAKRPHPAHVGWPELLFPEWGKCIKGPVSESEPYVGTRNIAILRPSPHTQTQE